MAENDKILLRRYHEHGDLQAREQLIEQASAAGDALPEGQQSLPCGAAHFGVGQALGLQRQRGHRRAKLVRRIGDEAALAIDGLRHARKQAVDRQRKRPDLDR